MAVEVPLALVLVVTVVAAGLPASVAEVVVVGGPEKTLILTAPDLSLARDLPRLSTDAVAAVHPHMIRDPLLRPGEEAIYEIAMAIMTSDVVAAAAAMAVTEVTVDLAAVVAVIVRLIDWGIGVTGHIGLPMYTGYRPISLFLTDWARTRRHESVVLRY